MTFLIHAKKTSSIYMKQFLIGSAIVFAVTLCVSRITYAQGTTYLSSLQGGTSGFVTVASDYWLALSFETGTNAGGYLLNSVQLKMFQASSNASGFAVTLYASTRTNVFGKPINDFGSLVGSDNPSTHGIYTYTASGVTLGSSTYYFIVLTAATASATGVYQLDAGGSPNSIGGWDTGFNYYSADNGASWSIFQPGGQFAINATAIPEPSASWFLLLGFGVVIYARRTFHR